MRPLSRGQTPGGAKGLKGNETINGPTSLVLQADNQLEIEFGCIILIYAGREIVSLASVRERFRCFVMLNIDFSDTSVMPRLRSIW